MPFNDFEGVSDKEWEDIQSNKRRKRMANRIVQIEKDQIEEHKRLDLISRSLTLALADMGYPHLSIHRLADAGNMLQYEVRDKKDEPQKEKIPPANAWHNTEPDQTK